MRADARPPEMVREALLPALHGEGHHPLQPRGERWAAQQGAGAGAGRCGGRPDPKIVRIGERLGFRGGTAMHEIQNEIFESKKKFKPQRKMPRHRGGRREGETALGRSG